jgi:hypothetical protein
VTAFFISCGEIPDDSELNEESRDETIINPAKPDQLSQIEKIILSDACIALQDKRTDFSEAIESNQVISFNYRGKKEFCTGQGYDFVYSAKVVKPADIIRFRNTTAGSANGFSDILFANSGDISPFCSKVLSGVLNSRVHRIGTKKAIRFEAVERSDSFFITLSTGYKRSENLFDIKEIEDFYIHKNSGVVLRRYRRDFRQCQNGNSQKQLVEMIL